MELKTKKGSIIKRHHLVGKRMGDCLYVHKDYIHGYLAHGTYNEYKSHLPENFVFDVVKIIMTNGVLNALSFISSPDFDSADEPIISDSYKVNRNGELKFTKEKKSPQIYHHKWLFVKDDYSGFNVSLSYKRSERWLTVSDKLNMSKIGYKAYWDKKIKELL